MFVNGSACTKGGSQAGESPAPWLMPAACRVVRQRASVAT